MVSKANLAIYQGDDFAAVVTVYNGTATPPDLTGYTVQSQIRLGPADTNPDVVVEIATALHPPNTINLSIPRNITVQLSGSYAWDLQLTAADGTVSTVIAGLVTVTPEVTREIA
jgi:hypothetical protein